MGATTKIEWADHTANPWTGCQHAQLSDGTPHQGCINCYAERFSKRNSKIIGQWGPEGTRVYHPSFWANCRKWNKQAAKAGVIRTVFPSMCDPFEDWQGPIVDAKGEQLMHVPGIGSCPISEAEPGDPMFHAVTMSDLRHALLSLIDECPNLLFLLLTKRPGNVPGMWPYRVCDDRLDSHPVVKAATINGDYCRALRFRDNVALIASISDQQSADELIPDLLGCRDLVKYLGVSVEPMTGPVDFRKNLQYENEQWFCSKCGWRGMPPDCCWRESVGCYICPKCPGFVYMGSTEFPYLDFAIIGGESGPNARPCNVEDIRSLVAQCRAAEVPCFVKQVGSRPYENAMNGPAVRAWGNAVIQRNGEFVQIHLKDPKGANPEEWPEDLRVRQLPWRAE